MRLLLFLLVLASSPVAAQPPNPRPVPMPTPPPSMPMLPPAAPPAAPPSPVAPPKGPSPMALIPEARAASTPGTYVDRWTLSTDVAFIGRIQIASATTARIVLEEPPATPNHASRFSLAQRVLNEPQFLAIRLSPLIAASIPVTSTDHDDDPATPPIVATTWTDEQLQTLMTQQWNLFASAFVPPAMTPPASGLFLAPGAGR